MIGRVIKRVNTIMYYFPSRHSIIGPRGDCYVVLSFRNPVAAFIYRICLFRVRVPNKVPLSFKVSFVQVAHTGVENPLSREGVGVHVYNSNARAHNDGVKVAEPPK